MLGMVRDFSVKHREGMLYIICGGFTTLVNYGAYVAFAWVDINPNICNILSWIVGVTFAFFVNKWIVFGSRTWDTRKTGTEAVEFLSARVFTFAVSVITFYLMYDIAGLRYGISIFSDDFLGFGEGFFTKIVGSMIEIALNWGLSKYWIFRKSNA